MPRRARVLSASQTYHIVIRGADRQLLFIEPKDFTKFMEILEYFKRECHFELYAYCLMTNHVHLIIHHFDEASLETIFRRINTTYCEWYNAKYKRTGFLLGDRFFSEPIETPDYLINAVRYIHFNPTKAGLETAPGSAYKWSSYTDYLHLNPNLTDTAFVLRLIGGVDNFKSLHRNEPEDGTLFDIEKLRKRLTDDIALEIISDLCQCQSPADFQKLSLYKREENLKKLHDEGISIRQLNRLTGTPIGIIQRLVKTKATTKQTTHASLE